jgi:parallel beta-helix repeat protein
MRIGSINCKFLNGICFTLFFFLSIIFISSTAWAATYFVDKSNSRASDSNSGTESAPFKTIQRGVNVAVAGDTVFVKGGIYYEKITGANSGMAGAPITFKNYGNDVVTIDGSNFSDYRVVYFRNNNHIIWDGLDVRNGATRGAWFRGDYSIIQNSKFYDNGSLGKTGATGLTVIESDNVIIRNCTAYKNGWNGISVEQSNNTTVEHNVSHDNTSHMGIQLFQNYSETGKMWSNNNVRYNTVYNNSNGIFSLHQENNEILNNVIFNNRDDGILLSATYNGISSYAGHTKIFNNTISGNGRYGIGNDSSTYMLVKNNIIANNGRAGIHDRQNSSTHEIDYDLYYMNGDVFIGSGTYSSVSSLSSYKGYEKHGVSGNPLFNNVSQMDYSLKLGSPSIDAGADISGELLGSSPSTDILGTARPQNGIFDIGAYEFKGGPVGISPPRNLRVINIL